MATLRPSFSLPSWPRMIECGSAWPGRHSIHEVPDDNFSSAGVPHIPLALIVVDRAPAGKRGKGGTCSLEAHCHQPYINAWYINLSARAGRLEGRD
jgi:hypothetical protein